MEMYTIDFKSIVSLSFDNARHALGSLYDGALALLQREGGPRVKTEAERRAENDRQRYNAQALAAGWQGLRFIK
jgi:hypothetical protein